MLDMISSHCRSLCRPHMLGVFSRQILKDTRQLVMSKTAKTMPRHFSMMAMEDTLPKLPVPPLQQTMDKYLKAIEPLVDADDFSNTKKIVEEFRKPGGTGERLHEKLLQKANTTDNWLAEWWNNVGYLEQRVPLVVNFSPSATFPKEYFTDSTSYLKYSARLITNVLKFRELILNESLSIDKLGKEPLSMIQYQLLLGGVRRPHVTRDEFVVAPKDQSKHVIVAHKNQFYCFDVYNADGTATSESQLLFQLLKVTENTEPLEEPVGILTTTDRTSWAKERNTLSKNKNNNANFELIDSALFVVCLDKPPVPSAQAPSAMESTTDSVTGRQSLHGDGINSNSLNRWVDKTLNFCISEDGHCGCLYEHTPAEGPTVARLWEYAMHNRQGYESILADRPDIKLPAPIKLKWNLKKSTLELIERSKYQLESLVDDTDVRCFKFDHYGKDFIKKQKLSPDAWIQILFQLTHYRLHGHIAPAYETGSTRKFKLGRTDTIRSASIPTLEFVQAMASSSCSNAERLSLMRKAIQAHSVYTKEAVRGQAIDRHLLGMKLLALESGMHLPEFYMDSSYGYSMHFKLSTSQVGFKEESYLIFGPAVPDGYGICYNPLANKLLVSVTSFNSNPTTNPGHFAAYLQRSLDDMQLLTAAAKL